MDQSTINPLYKCYYPLLLKAYLEQREERERREILSLQILNARANYELLQPDTDVETDSSEDEPESKRFCPYQREDNQFANSQYKQPAEVIVIEDSDDESDASDETELNLTSNGAGSVKSANKDVILPDEDNAGENFQLQELVDIIDLCTPARENPSSVSQCIIKYLLKHYKT